MRYSCARKWACNAQFCRSSRCRRRNGQNHHQRRMDLKETNLANRKVSMMNGFTSSRWPPHIDALYREDTTQLRFMKRQQWIVTNYLLVLLTGIFGIVRALNCVPGWVICAAVAIIATATILTIILLIIIQCDMKAPRDRLAKTYDYWDCKERTRFGLTTTPTNWLRSLPFLSSLLLVCFFGGIVVGYAVVASAASSSVSSCQQSL